jgi:hypothetical protein
VRRGRAAQVPLKAYHHAYEVQGRVHAPAADACRPRAAQRRRTQVREVWAHMRGSRVHARCSRAAQASYQVHNRAYWLCGRVLVRLVDALRPRAAQRRRTEVMVARAHMRGSRVHARCSRAAQASYQLLSHVLRLCGRVAVRLVDALRPRAAQRRRTEVMPARARCLAEECRCGAAGLRRPRISYSAMYCGCAAALWCAHASLFGPALPSAGAQR